MAEVELARKCYERTFILRSREQHRHLCADGYQKLFPTHAHTHTRLRKPGKGRLALGRYAQVVDKSRLAGAASGIILLFDRIDRI